MSRTVKSLQTGEVFIETGRREWSARLAAWRADHTEPCPMPRGHLMFRKPAECGCVPWTLDAFIAEWSAKITAGQNPPTCGAL